MLLKTCGTIKISIPQSTICGLFATGIHVKIGAHISTRKSANRI